MSFGNKLGLLLRNTAVKLGNGATSAAQVVYTTTTTQLAELGAGLAGTDTSINHVLPAATKRSRK